jgi:uncharacterized protein YaiI (UPF0178 family)
MAKIYVDADACPVKNEAYAIAKRLNLIVHVVANQWMNMPDDPMIRLEVVDDGFDAADHWIVERVGRSDVVVTDDILLAGRCIEKGARVITNRGVVRDANNIGEALAMRELMQYVRASGDTSGNQKPLDEADRRRFRQELDKLANAALRTPSNDRTGGGHHA